jgi:hypothetical protein
VIGSFAAKTRARERSVVAVLEDGVSTSSPASVRAADPRMTVGPLLG